jgi:hypothetical protein
MVSILLCWSLYIWLWHCCKAYRWHWGLNHEGSWKKFHRWTVFLFIQVFSALYPLVYFYFSVHWSILVHITNVVEDDDGRSNSSATYSYCLMKMMTGISSASTCSIQSLCSTTVDVNISLYSFLVCLWYWTFRWFTAFKLCTVGQWTSSFEAEESPLNGRKHENFNRASYY